MTGLDPGATYAFRVRGIYGSNVYSPYSAVASVTTEAFAAPADLAYAVVSGSRVDLAWRDTTDNEGGFQVERSADGGATWQGIGTPGANQTSFSATGLTPGTTYSFRVRGTRAPLYSPYVTAVTVAPSGIGAPTNLYVSSTGTSGTPATKYHDLSWWDNSPSETGFQVERRAAGEASFTPIGTTAAGATTYRATGLDPAVTYTFRVRAVNAAEQSAYSDEATAGVSPVRVPGDLGVTVLSGTAVRLAWRDNSDNEQYFKVERSADAGATWSEVAGYTAANQTNWTDTGVLPGRAYAYRVRASHASGVASAYTATATAQTTPFAAPSELVARAVSGGRVELAWRDNTDSETYFKVERSENGGTTWQVIQDYGAANRTSYADTGVQPGRAYAYRVRGYHSSGTLSAYTATATATTPAFGGPSDLTATVLSGSRVDLAWQDNTDNEYFFHVERSGDGGATWQEVNAYVQPNRTSYSDTSLQPGRGYVYRVRGRHGNGTFSGYTNAVAVTTTSFGAPTALSTEVVSGSRVDLTWRDNTDNEYYFHVERSADGGTSWQEINAYVQPNRTSYSDTSLQPGTAYAYRVRGRHGSGAYSAYTNVAAAATPAFGVAAGLSGYVLSGTEVRLTWRDNTDNEYQFQVQYSGDGGVTWTEAGYRNANQTTFPVTGLRQGREYAFRVRARHGNGTNSAFTDPLTLTTVAPLAPSGLAVQRSAAGDRADLSWRDHTDDEYYFRVERSEDAGATWTSAGYTDASRTSFAATGLNPAKSYSFRLRAELAGAIFSPYGYAGDAAPTLAAPGGLAASAAGADVTLAWADAAAGETGYKVERRDAPGGAWSEVAVLPAGATGFADWSLPAGTYDYRVRAYLGTTVLSDYSPEATVTTSAGAATVDLAFEGLAEADEEAAGGWIRLNTDHDEDNRTSGDQPLDDYEANALASAGPLGHRIVTGDDEVRTATLTLDGVGVRGRYTLTFPTRLKVYRANADGSFTRLSSGVQSAAVDLPHTVPLRVEAVSSSAAINDAEIKASFAPATGGSVPSDRVKLTVFNADLDVDSDNDNGFNLPEGDKHEGELEQDPAAPGKTVVFNGDDTDADAVADLADGYDRDAAKPNADDQTVAERFVPVVLVLPAPINPAVARVRLNYSGSDPAGVTVTTDAGGGELYTPAAGHLRLWRKDGGAARDGRTVASAGDYLAPGDYAASSLGFSTSKRQVVVYVEGVAGTTDDASRTLEMVIDPDGAGGFRVPDGARVTVTVPARKPSVTTSADALAYPENAGPLAADTGLAVEDADSPDLAGATVRITGNYQAGQDVLAFAGAGGITGAWDPATGTLTLTGAASVAAYQAALRAVTYQNTSEDPSPATRTLTFTVTDAGGLMSDPAQRTVIVAPSNDAPVLSAIEQAPASYTAGDAPAAVTGTLVVGDVDSATLASATVRITGNYQAGQDVLAFTDAGGITGAWDAASGTLTLTGVAGVAAYQSALRSVTYANAGSDPTEGTRTVMFTVYDGGATSNAVSRDVAVSRVNEPPSPGSIEGYVWNDLNANRILDGEFIQSDTPHFIYIADVSDSVNGFNSDTRQAIKDLNTRLIDAGFGDTARISMITSYDASTFDLDPYQAGLQSFVTAAALNPTGDRLLLDERMDGNPGPGANYEDFYPDDVYTPGKAMDLAREALVAGGVEFGDPNIIFLGDGQNGDNADHGRIAREIKAAYGGNVRAFGIVGYYLDELRKIDPAAVGLDSADELAAIFGGLISSDTQLDESKLANWTVYLDDNNNGTLDAGERSHVTGDNGSYSFGNLAPGFYRVRILEQADWDSSVPENGEYPVNLLSGHEIEDLNFGQFQSPAGMFFNSGRANEGAAVDVRFAQVMGESPFMYSYDFNNDGDFTDEYDTNGNGVFDPGVDLADLAGTTQDRVSHVFGDNGDHTVRARITDVAGRTRDFTTVVNVKNVAPSVRVDDPTATPREDEPITLGATVSDPGWADTPFTYAWEITKDGDAYNPGLGVALNQPTLTFTPSAGGSYTVKLTATDKDGGAGSDESTFQVTANAAPYFVWSPWADPNPTGGTTAALQVAAQDDGGEQALTYTWSVQAKPQGAPDPTFGVNATNAAKQTTVSFALAGAYTFAVVATDRSGASTPPATVAVTVNQTLATMMISPEAPSVPAGTSQAFAVAGTDQFGAPMAPAGVVWSVSGASGANISQGGVYTAGFTAGDDVVTATAGGVSDTAAVTVSSTGDGEFPIVTIAASPAEVDEGSLGTVTYTLSLDRPAPMGGLIVSFEVDSAGSGAAELEDYQLDHSGSVSVPGDASFATIALAAREDADTEDETVTLRLVDGDDYNLGTPFNAGAIIRDDDAGGGNPGTPPEPVTHLAATSLSNTEIRLDWVDVSTQEDGYRVYRWELPVIAAPRSFEVSPNAETFLDQHLEEGVSYQYRGL